jgi:hypothetical protein
MGTCKIAGNRPCINATDCAYGTCGSTTPSMCPLAPDSGDLCTSDADSGQKRDSNRTCEAIYTGFGFACF